MYNTKTSRRRHKRELPSHTCVTNSGYLKTYAREGRSTHEGKVGVSLSASLSGRVSHTGRGFFWSDHAEKQGQPLSLSHPLGLAPHWLNSPCILLCFVAKRSACALVSGTRVSSDAKNPSPPEPPFMAGYAFTPDGQRSATSRRFCANGYPGWLPRRWSGNSSPS